MTATQQNTELERAMRTIAGLRKKYPQYEDLSDQNLATAVVKKYPVYADVFAPITSQPPPPPEPVIAPPSEDDADQFLASMKPSAPRPAVPSPSQAYLRSPMAAADDPAARESRLETLRAAEGSQTIQGLHDQTRARDIGRVQSAAASFATSAGEGVGQIVGGLETPLKATGVIEPGGGIGNWITEQAETARDLTTRGDGGMLDMVAGGLGSTVPFLATGGLGQAAGLGARGALAMSGGVGAVQGIGRAYEEAQDANASELQTALKTAIGGLAGSTEAIPINRALGRLDKITGGAISRGVKKYAGRTAQAALSGAVEEAIQEVVQTAMYTGLGDQVILGLERDLVDEMTQGGTVGGIVGGILSGMFGQARVNALRRRQRSIQNAGSTTPPAASETQPTQPSAEAVQAPQMPANAPPQPVSAAVVDTVVQQAVANGIPPMRVLADMPAEQVETLAQAIGAGSKLDLLRDMNRRYRDVIEASENAEQEARIEGPGQSPPPIPTTPQVREETPPPTVMPSVEQYDDARLTGPATERAVDPTPIVREEVTPEQAQPEAVQPSPQESTEMSVNPEAANPSTGLVSEGYVAARKQRDGTYSLTLSNDDTIEVFPGERFKSPSEAHRTLKAYNAKRHAAVQPKPPAPQSKPQIIARLRELGDTGASTNMTGEVLAERLAAAEATPATTSPAPAPAERTPATPPAQAKDEGKKRKPKTAPRFSAAGEQADADYRGSHRAPTGEFGEGSLDAMDRTYPDDVYDADASRIYGDRADARLDAKAAAIIRRFRGKPNAEVMVYRAVPKGRQTEIRPGDWVTPVREYAAMHGERFDEGTDIIGRKVKAGELFTEGNSLFEYGWQPKSSSRFSAAGQPADPAIRKAIEDIAARSPAAAPTTVLDSVDQLKDAEPEAYAEAQRRGLLDSIDGVFINGRVYIIANRIPNVARAEQVWLEEQRHNGLRSIMLPTWWNRMGDMVSKAMMPEAEAIAQQYHGAAFGSLTAEQRNEVVEELMIRVAERRGANPSLWQRVQAFIRGSLRTMGLNIKLSEADMLALVRRADRARGVGRGGKSRFSAAKLSPTLKINGKDRPTTNSAGQPIHPTEAGVRAFWEWFGSSRVVDEQGRPLVVYHGTKTDVPFTIFQPNDEGYNSAGKGSYFSDKISTGMMYADGIDSRLMRVYLAIKNPATSSDVTKIINDLFNRRVIRKDQAVALRDTLVAAGHDGVAWKAQTSDETVYVAFDPTQIKSATGNRGTFDASNPDIRFSMVPGSEPTKKTVNRVTGVTKPTVPESEAIKAKMKARGEVARQRAAAKARLAVELDRLRLRMRGDQATADGLREEAAGLVLEHLPKNLQGRYIRSIVRADSLAKVKNVIRRMRGALAKDSMREAVRNLQRFGRRIDKLSSNDLRKEAKAIYQRAMDAYTKTDTNGKTLAKLPNAIKDVYAAVDAVNEAVAELALMAAEDRAAKKAFAADKIRTRDEHVNVTEANIKATGDTSKFVDEGTQTQRSANIFRRLGREFLDITSLASKVEGLFDGNGVLYNLMGRRIKRATDRMHLELKDVLSRLDAAAQKRGFKSLHDALIRMAGSLGDASTERIKAKIGGKTYDLTLDQAANLVAYDPETQLLIDKGIGVTFKTGKNLSPIPVTNAEIAVIAKQLRDYKAADVTGFVEDMKREIDSMRPRVFAALKRLKGMEPEMVDKYFPRFRNRGQSETAGTALGWRDIAKKYSENAGFTKERERGTDTPLLVKGALATTINHLNESLKIIHLAEAVRDADMVLSHPRIQRAIAGRWGEDQLKRLSDMLAAHSLANETATTPMEHAINVVNRGLAGSYLTLNEGTFIRQLGGIPKLYPIMGGRLMADGMKRIFDSTITDRILKYSGFGWARYAMDAAARYSAVKGSGASEFIEVDPGNVSSIRRFATEARTGAAAMIRGVRAGDMKSVWRGWDEIRQSIKILNYFDSLVFRVAWGGYEAEVNRLHPDWSTDQKMEWVAEKASDAIRATQNSSDVADMTHAAIEGRGKVLGAFLLFTSDPQKSMNMLYQAAHRSLADFRRTVIGVSLNSLWSGVVTTGGLTAFYGALALLLKGDDDEESWAELREKSLDRGFMRTLQDVAGLGFAVGDKVVAAIEAKRNRWQERDLLGVPAVDIINELARGMIDIGDAIARMDETKQDVFIARLSRGLFRSLMATSAAVGNPAHMPIIRATTVKRQVDSEYKKTDAITRAAKLVGEGEWDRAVGVVKRWNEQPGENINISQVISRTGDSGISRKGMDATIAKLEKAEAAGRLTVEQRSQLSALRRVRNHIQKKEKR